MLPVMITPAYCRTMSRYNTWMNGRLYGLASGIPDDARKEDRGAPFRSIHGTLNHLLLGDRIWMGRFLGEPFPAKSLDQELYAGFDELRAARQAEDARIQAWAETLTQERLEGDLTFRSVVNPIERTMPMWLCVTHFFNHQTHHRGQVTTLLEQCGLDIGVTDLLMLPAE
jgi:uncharacterized damage-inducible protein DinB